MRLQIVRSTDEEVICWGENTEFRAGVLSRAWVVSEEERRTFEEEVERKKRREERWRERKRRKEQGCEREKSKGKGRARGSNRPP
jgi:hypothetical protein